LPSVISPLPEPAVALHQFSTFPFIELKSWGVNGQIVDYYPQLQIIIVEDKCKWFIVNTLFSGYCCCNSLANGSWLNESEEEVPVCFRIATHIN
jgi:hypothetical protein